MMKRSNNTPAIAAFGFIAAGAETLDELDQLFKADAAPFTLYQDAVIFPVNESKNEALEAAVSSIHGGSRLDRSVKLAAKASLNCLQNLGSGLDGKIVVNIGSSRGATETWEYEFKRFSESGQSSPKASPYSTAGNISSNIAQLLNGNAFAIDHSVTCGSGLQAIANACAWIKAGMADAAIAGGTEAPLTPFTISQMRALKITANASDHFPAKPLYAGTPKTGMALGEGAAVFAVVNSDHFPQAEFFIEGIGLANEKGGSASGITGEGQALHGAMKQAMQHAGNIRPDLIITHAPGTEKGDQAEISAIHSLFGTEIPALFSNKHVFGHTLGASGSLSLVTACYILKKGKLPPMPYTAEGQVGVNRAIKSIMVNATGFGGNAISIIITKNELPI